MDKIKLGKRIVSLRKDRNMTQKDLADNLHVTVPAVSKWERGLNFPDIVLLEPLANIFNISVAELLTQSPSIQFPPKEVKEYIQSLIIIAMNNLQKEQKTQKKLLWMVAASILTILILAVVLINMVRFVHSPSFQIIKTEYITSSSTINNSSQDVLSVLEIYVYTQDMISQEEIKEHTDYIYEQWQTGIFSDREIEAIHILYFDSLNKLNIPDGYFHEAYILTQ